MKRYLYVLCYEDLENKDPSFAHIFVRALNKEEAYTKGAEKVSARHPELRGHWINDYVVVVGNK